MHTWPCITLPRWSALHLDPQPDGTLVAQTSYGGDRPEYTTVVLGSDAAAALARHAAVVCQALADLSVLPGRYDPDREWTPQQREICRRASAAFGDDGARVETYVKWLIDANGWVCRVTTLGRRVGHYCVYMRPQQWAEIAAVLAEAYVIEP